MGNTLAAHEEARMATIEQTGRVVTEFSKLTGRQAESCGHGKDFGFYSK